MNDENLATQISTTIPPEGRLAARVAQVERAVLGINSERVNDYQKQRAEAHEIEAALDALRTQIATITLTNQGLREDLRWNRTAIYVLAGFVILAVAFTVTTAVIGR
jgi:hypothetical protein